MAAFIRDWSDQPRSTDPIAVSETLQGTGGVFYTIELNLECKASGPHSLHGSIRDNNPYQFSLLEERMDFGPER